jgi:hypothetical protein
MVATRYAPQPSPMIIDMWPVLWRCLVHRTRNLLAKKALQTSAERMQQPPSLKDEAHKQPRTHARNTHGKSSAATIPIPARQALL